MQLLSPNEEQILINASPLETRIALLENGRVAEIFIERNSQKAIVGNIFKGLVSRVLPGMNSAFINIGLKKSAFLFGGDVFDFSQPIELSQGKPYPSVSQPIGELLKDGQNIVVQVVKEALGTKGPRVSTYLTIPGRLLVLVPNLSHVGVSRRIEDDASKDDLRAYVESIKPPNVGCIIRTATLTATREEIVADLECLLKIWKTIEQRLVLAEAPSLVYSDLNLCEKILRDLYKNETRRILVDDLSTYHNLYDFLSRSLPSALDKLSFYEGPVPLFDVYGVEVDIASALASKVVLPSGGHLFIDQTEALTCFDINTGKFVGSSNSRQTILQTNLEAAVKIVEQLRLRNIGGIIVLDFIDMEYAEDRERVFQSLVEELKKDRAKTNVLKISELGLIQMTRKRTSESLERQLLTSCPYCEGRGRVRSIESESLDLLREIVRCSLQSQSSSIRIIVRPDIREWLETHYSKVLKDTAQKHKIEIAFVNSSLSTTLLRELPYEVIPS